MTNHPEVSDPLAAFSSEDQAATAPRAVGRSWSRERWIAIAVTGIAVVQALVILRAYGVLQGRASEGRLYIASSAPGAEVLVNGTVSGPAPLELPLRAGRHTVQVRYAGVTREFTADVRAGEQTHHHVDFSAPPDPQVVPTVGEAGSIEIASDPQGARIAIDGQSHGVTPRRVTDLPPGEHDVVLTSATGSVKRRVVIAAGRPASLVVTMPRPTTPTSGWVRVQLPLEARIYQGNELIATTEVDRLMLPAGRHTLRLVNPALQFEQTQTVEVVAGETRTLNVAVPNGLISINAIPWAQVSIDGSARGETPIGNLAVPIGTHEIVFTHPELGEQRRTVTVTLGGVTRVGVDLRR